MLGIELRTRAGRLGAAPTLGATVALVAWLCVWWAFGFRFTEARDPSLAFDRAPLLRETKMKELLVANRDPQDIEAWPDSAPVRAVTFLERYRLMPRAWIYGLWYTYESTLTRGGYLRGAYSDTGWWYFSLRRAGGPVGRDRGEYPL